MNSSSEFRFDLQTTKRLIKVDDLCTENAIMLHRFNRYPLIIDPSGQAAEFIMKQFAHKNIQKTSFLDESFRLAWDFLWNWRVTHFQKEPGIGPSIRQLAAGAGRRELRPDPQPGPESRSQANGRPSAHHPGRSGHRLVACFPDLHDH